MLQCFRTPDINHEILNIPVHIISMSGANFDPKVDRYSEF